MGRCERTIYREKKRGSVRHPKSDLTEALEYNADFAQDRAYENGTAKGPAEKIGGNSKQLIFMADMLKGNKWPPDALVMHLKQAWLAWLPHTLAHQDAVPLRPPRLSG